ncbi:MAG TPA: N-methyl-L-tryptophan oxidase, partial [Verrucomicrobiales bacterium]|nr:N-methyl-L-tryptophan oxidase [Verrucomicrobiales bacterium]
KEVDPSTVIRDKLPKDDSDIQDALTRYLPSGKGPLLSQRVCLYTNSSDGDFIIDRHPEFPQVSLACGFSGHGFKFASVIGKVLADLATNGKTDWPIGFLRLSRFAR